MFKNKNKNVSRSRGTRSSDDAVFMYTYHNVRDKFDEQRDRNEKKEVLPKFINPFKRLSALVVLIILIIAVINLLYLSPTPKVYLLNSNPKITSLYNSLYGHSVYTAVKNYLDSSLFNYNKLSINLNSLNNKIISNFPIITNTSYNIPLFKNQVGIYLTTSNPVLLVFNGSSSYVLNQNGEVVIHDNNYSSIKNLNLPKVIIGIPNIKLGQTIFSQQEVSFMETVFQQLNVKKYTITYMKIGSSGEELDTYLSGKSYYIKFNLAGNDATLEAGRFLATINYLNTKKINPSQYIDVRSEGRVFYK